MPVVASPKALVTLRHDLRSLVVARPQALVALQHDLQSIVAASF